MVVDDAGGRGRGRGKRLCRLGEERERDQDAAQECCERADKLRDGDEAVAERVVVGEKVLGAERPAGYLRDGGFQDVRDRDHPRSGRRGGKRVVRGLDVGVPGQIGSRGGPAGKRGGRGGEGFCQRRGLKDPLGVDVCQKGDVLDVVGVRGPVGVAVDEVHQLAPGHVESHGGQQPLELVLGHDAAPVRVKVLKEREEVHPPGGHVAPQPAENRERGRGRPQSLDAPVLGHRRVRGWGRDGFGRRRLEVFLGKHRLDFGQKGDVRDSTGRIACCAWG